MRREFRAFFSYFGAKWWASPRYPAPEHDTIVEPFAGAAGYATAYFRRKVILIEKNPIIAQLWDFLIRATHHDIMSIPMLREGQKVSELDAIEPARNLVGFWMNQGSTFPHDVPGSWAKTHPDDFWSERQRARIAAQVAEIKHWKIIHGSYEEAPRLRATWFVDPPYQAAGKRYACSSKDIDFEKLGSWCRRRRGLVMVCENEGATWLPFVPFTGIAGQRKKSTEVLWTERNDR